MKSQNPIRNSPLLGLPTQAVRPWFKIALWGLSGGCLILAATFAFVYATKAPTLPSAGGSGDEVVTGASPGPTAEQAKAPVGEPPAREPDALASVPPVSSVEPEPPVTTTNRMRIPAENKSLPWRSRPGFTIFAYNIELASITVVDNAFVIGGRMRIEIGRLRNLSVEERSELARIFDVEIAVIDRFIVGSPGAKPSDAGRLADALFDAVVDYKWILKQWDTIPPIAADTEKRDGRSALQAGDLERSWEIYWGLVGPKVPQPPQNLRVVSGS